MGNLQRDQQLFGYNRDDQSSYLSADEAIRLLIDIVSKNGNLLLNVGPCADGGIDECQWRYLLGLGAWLDVNGEAIHNSRPWIRAESTTGTEFPCASRRREPRSTRSFCRTPREAEIRIRDLRIAARE